MRLKRGKFVSDNIQLQANPNSDVIKPSDLSYIDSAEAAILQQSPKGGRYVIWASLAFVLVAIVWANFAYLDEFARGEGTVIPSQKVQRIQNLEGGILSELFVSEGMSVLRDQKLLRIDDTQFSSSFNEADVTLMQLKARVFRLQVELSGQSLTRESAPNISAEIFSQQQALFRSRINELNSNKSVLEQQVIQRKQEYAEMMAKSKQIRTSYNLLKKELDLTRPLAAQGAVSEVEVIRLERQLNDLAGELNAATLSLPRIEASLNEAKEKRNNVTLVFRREAEQELNEAQLELSRLEETSQALEDRVDRTLVRSPVAGTVKQLLVTTIGGIIQPGMDIVEIVPNEEKLVVEASVRPQEIAYILLGQKALVKFSAYDFAVHGGLEGKVIHISPDTIEDEEGESFYTVKVETQRVFTGVDGKELPLIPGMTVSIDILTGKKTVMSYLLKPILKTKQLALRER